MDLIFEPGRKTNDVQDEVVNYIADNGIELSHGIPAIFIYQGLELDNKLFMLGNTFRLGKFINDVLNQIDRFKRVMVLFDRDSGLTYVMFTTHEDAQLPEVLTRAGIVVGHA